MNEYEWPVARLLDLRTAYPRVSKPTLWRLLQRYGMNGKRWRLNYLHESAEFKVRGKESMSDACMLVRDL